MGSAVVLECREARLVARKTSNCQASGRHSSLRAASFVPLRRSSLVPIVRSARDVAPIRVTRVLGGSAAGLIHTAAPVATLFDLLPRLDHIARTARDFREPLFRRLRVFPLPRHASRARRISAICHLG